MWKCIRSGNKSVVGVAIILFRELCLSWRPVVTLAIFPLETSIIPRLLCYSVAICIVFTHRADVFKSSSVECWLHCVSNVASWMLLFTLIDNLGSSIAHLWRCRIRITPRWMKRYRSMCFFTYRPRYRSAFQTRSTWEKMAREWIHQFLPWKLYWRVPWVTETTPLTSYDVKPLLSAHIAV